MNLNQMFVYVHYFALMKTFEIRLKIPMLFLYEKKRISTDAMATDKWFSLAKHQVHFEIFM